MEYSHLIETKYDDAFVAISKLTWLPWVGKRYAISRSSPKLLIIGESHNAKANDVETMEEVRTRHENDIHFTRDILWDELINADADIPTFRNIPRLLFSDASYKKNDFWQDVAFLNLVQRMMLHKIPPDERPERPTWDCDYTDGWDVVYDVLNILKPDYCILMGTESHNRFWYAMDKRQADFSDVQETEKVGRYWGYHADIKIDQKRVPLEFVRHPGSFFSPTSWHAYITRRFPSEMVSLHKEYLF